MASTTKFEAAIKIDTAPILPYLLSVMYLEWTSVLPSVQKIFHEEMALGGNVARLTLGDGQIFHDREIIVYLTTLFTVSDSEEQATRKLAFEVESQIRQCERLSSTDVATLSHTLRIMNLHLNRRAFLVNDTSTLADIVAWARLRGNHNANSVMQELPHIDHIWRWYRSIESMNLWMQETIAALAAFETRKKTFASAAAADYETELPIVDGPMVTRFSLKPSCTLHVGHAKAALWNDVFAHRRPGGLLICRFDDSSPHKSQKLHDSILDELKLIGIVPDKISYSSDYYQEMYEYALQLIESGKAFADDSLLSEVNNERRNRYPSARRDMDIEETLQHFAEMKSGSAEGQRWCLRARTTPDLSKVSLRDPIIYRCNQLPHHRTGSRWRMYPTHDFCSPILDSIEGVTVALQSDKFRDRITQYEWFQTAFRLRRVDLWDFSDMKFVRTVLSTRKLSIIVKDGDVWGWDDPRMPTVRGILRRGMDVASFREFVLQQGLSKNAFYLEWDAFWALNRKNLDPVTPRHTAIDQKDAVRCRVIGFGGPDIATKPKYVNNLKLGTKKLHYGSMVLIEQCDAQSFKQDEEVTLTEWGNAFVRKITRSVDRHTIVSIDLELNLDGDVKNTSKKVAWLAEDKAKLVSVNLVTFHYLLTKDVLSKSDRFVDFLTADTKSRVKAFADCDMAELPRGATVHFERKGYFRLDVPYKQDNDRMVFFNIPGGKS